MRRYTVDLPLRRFSAKAPRSASHFTAPWIERSDRQVRLVIEAIDGQHWPSSFAWSASEISTALVVGGIFSGQHALMIEVDMSYDVPVPASSRRARLIARNAAAPAWHVGHSLCQRARGQKTIAQLRQMCAASFILPPHLAADASKPFGRLLSDDMHRADVCGRRRNIGRKGVIR